MLSAEWLLPSVRQFVFLQIASLCEGLVANIAAVRLLTTVSLHVTFQIGSLVCQNDLSQSLHVCAPKCADCFHPSALVSAAPTHWKKIENQISDTLFIHKA